MRARGVLERDRLGEVDRQAPVVDQLGELLELLPVGPEVLVHFGIGAQPVRNPDVAAAVGQEAIEATEVQAQEKGSLFVARVDRESRAREQEAVRLAVNTKRLHFFDPETGAGLYG